MTNTTVNFVLSSPYFNSSENVWQRTGVYVDEQGNFLGDIFLFSHPEITSLPQEDNWERAIAGGILGGAIGFTVGLATSGNILTASASGVAGFLLGLTDPARQFFADSIANGMAEIYSDSSFGEPNQTTVFFDGSFLTLTLPTDNDFNQYYSIKLGTAVNDILIATSEYIVADAGNDTIVGIDGASASIDGGEDIDTLSYTNLSQGIFIDMDAAQSALGELAPIKDVFDNIENIVGSEFNDTIHGDSNNNLLNGGGGDDIIIGGGGQDTIIGGAGVDTIQYIGGSSGTSTISGVEHVKIGNDNISGNWQEGETEGEYRKGGVTATKDGDDLVIDAGGNQIRIDDFDEETNNYGVNLQEKDDDEPPSDDNTPSQIDEAADLFGRAQVNQFTDPLVLDLDGDGIELLNLDESNVYFDMTGDGLLVRAAANDNMAILTLTKAA